MTTRQAALGISTLLLAMAAVALLWLDGLKRRDQDKGARPAEGRRKVAYGMLGLAVLCQAAQLLS